MRKVSANFNELFPTPRSAWGHNHYRVALPDGRVVIVSGSPGDLNFMRHAVSDARRQLKKDTQ